jgi:hypothetical protein
MASFIGRKPELTSSISTEESGQASELDETVTLTNPLYRADPLGTVDALSISSIICSDIPSGTYLDGPSENSR